MLTKIKSLFTGPMWKSRFGVMALTSLLSLLWFDIDWCLATTFRPMSDWLLWSVTLTAALLLTLPYVLSRKVWLQIVVLAIADMVMLANLMYCRTYFAAIPPESYLLAGNLADFTASVRASLRWPDALAIVILAWGWLTACRLRRRDIGRLGLRYSILLAAGILICAVGIALRGGFYKAYDKLVQSCYYSTAGVPTYTLAGHIAYSLLDRHYSSGGDGQAALDEWLDAHKRLTTLTPLAALERLPDGLYFTGDSAATRRSVVLIVCESLESWPVEARIAGKEVTPYINSLLADSATLYVPRLLTQVDAGRSIDFQLMLNTGLLPMKGSVYSMKFPDVTYPSLNKAMREKYGTKSLIFTCDKPITWNQAAIANAFGYDSLLDRRNWQLDELIGNPAKLSDGSFLRQSTAKLQSDKAMWPVDSSAMLTFITYSGHNPFKLPQDMTDADFAPGTNDLPERLADYVNMAHYTDSQLHQLVDYVFSRSDGASTMVVITGDHEGLAGERAELHAAAPTLVDPGQHTPMIILNSPVGGRYDDVAGQIDIYPTLLNLMGLEAYGWHGMGESIFQPGKAGMAISSMTMAEEGDTAVNADKLKMLRDARKTSDRIIRTNYFEKHK